MPNPKRGVAETKIALVLFLFYSVYAESEFGWNINHAFHEILR